VLHLVIANDPALVVENDKPIARGSQIQRTDIFGHRFNLLSFVAAN
jgi:hypothetical protein